MKLARRISGALMLCACLAACQESEQHLGPLPQPTKTAPAGFDVDTAKAVALAAQDAGPATATVLKATSISSTAPVLPAEQVAALRATLPLIKDARVLEELQAIPQSRMARLVVCMEQSVEESTSQILRAYRKAKWRDLTVHTPPHDENRRSFTAMKDGFRLSGSAYQGAFKDCEKSKDFTRVSFSFHERLDAAPTPASAGSETAKQPATLASPRLMRRDGSRDAQ